MTTTPEQLARRFVLEHNQAGFRQAFDDLLTADVRIHEYLPGLPETLDRTGYEGFITGFRAALPDVRNEIADLFVCGDRAAVRWTGGGTHAGADLMGLPARGKPVQAHGVYVLRFRGDRIAEVWNHWDNLNVHAQLAGG